MNNQNINPKSLKGKEVFNRTLELMDKLTPINESVINASLEFVKRAPNGLVYTIIRENHKYFIKTTDKIEFKVSELDYVGGLKNKMTESYSSYEEALKHLNMKFQQLNEMYGIKGGYNLFEQDSVETEDSSNEETGTTEKKYKLKVSSDSAETSEEPMPSAELGSPEGEETPEAPSIEDVPSSPEGEEMDMSSEEPSPETEPEVDVETEEDEEDIDIDEDEDPKKYIQKLTGRLGQKLRELSEVDPKLEKYVINSIISALHVDKMDKKDRMDVIRKFKKKKGMESIMKESYDMDEYYGMMSLKGPFNYEKLRGGFDEDAIHSHSKSHRPLRFKKYEVGMDEELHGGQHKLDLNKNGRLDKEDFRMLRSKKKKSSSDEQWQGLAARAIGSAIGSYAASKMGSDENEKHLEREKRIEDAIRRVTAKRKKSSDERFEDIKFHSSKDEGNHYDMDEMDIEELFMNGGEPDVMDPEIEIDEPLSPPVPEFPDPWNPEKPKVMPNPKAGKKDGNDNIKMDKSVGATEKELTFESIIEKYRVKK